MAYKALILDHSWMKEKRERKRENKKNHTNKEPIPYDLDYKPQIYIQYYLDIL